MAASIAIPPCLSFHPHEDVETGFVRILEQLASCAALTAQHPQEKLSDSVHNTRVLIKRLRALLWFAQPALHSSEMNHANLCLQKASQTTPDRRTIRLMERVDELQEKLGDYHDSVVVQGHLQEKAPDKASPLLVKHSVDLLEKRKQRIRDEVRKIAKHIN